RGADRVAREVEQVAEDERTVDLGVDALGRDGAAVGRGGEVLGGAPPGVRLGRAAVREAGEQGPALGAVTAWRGTGARPSRARAGWARQSGAGCRRAGCRARSAEIRRSASAKSGPPASMACSGALGVNSAATVRLRSAGQARRAGTNGPDFPSDSTIRSRSS